ncbi:hypothetical protein OS493_000908 [Desmophyllum pertusum]|uniref:Uncharacterized protein n=1 Tax=Desmophyllum pertusum TaxID=174260 RepID=A0A9W9ZUU7_9CNID|nr:hypothetical protein OS493_000908 [Desmophyllum pertusum]
MDAMDALCKTINAKRRNARLKYVVQYPSYGCFTIGRRILRILSRYDTLRTVVKEVRQEEKWLEVAFKELPQTEKHLVSEALLDNWNEKGQYLVQLKWICPGRSSLAGSKMLNNPNKEITVNKFKLVSKLTIFSSCQVCKKILKCGILKCHNCGTRQRSADLNRQASVKLCVPDSRHEQQEAIAAKGSWHGKQNWAKLTVIDLL